MKKDKVKKLEFHVGIGKSSTGYTGCTDLTKCSQKLFTYDVTLDTYVLYFDDRRITEDDLSRNTVFVDKSGDFWTVSDIAFVARIFGIVRKEAESFVSAYGDKQCSEDLIGFYFGSTQQELISMELIHWPNDTINDSDEIPNFCTLIITLYLLDRAKDEPEDEPEDKTREMWLKNQLLKIDKKARLFGLGLVLRPCGRYLNDLGWYSQNAVVVLEQRARKLTV